jgi:hypothetical protein
MINANFSDNCAGGQSFNKLRTIQNKFAILNMFLTKMYHRHALFNQSPLRLIVFSEFPIQALYGNGLFSHISVQSLRLFRVALALNRNTIGDTTISLFSPAPSGAFVITPSIENWFLRDSPPSGPQMLAGRTSQPWRM